MAEKNDKKLLETAHKRLKKCIDDDEENRKKMLDDLKFCTLDQWDDNIRKSRENDVNGARPCLTIDKINQYIVQVVNDIRQNKPSIKIRPIDDNADVETAKVFQGLIRHIEDKSSASIAYVNAAEWAVKCGRGYFRITTDYKEGSFDEQDIFIRQIPDAFSVYLGPHSMPDGSDAKFGFVIDQMPLDDFKREYPKAKTNKKEFEDLENVTFWRDEDSITVVEYFYTEFETKTIYADENDKTSKSREQQKETVKWCKLTGAESLEERDWAGKYIPIIKVIGRESIVEGKSIVWGLVRPAKDNLRMYNYWASAITEKLGLSPKAPFIGAKGQFAGVEEQWKNANSENRAYLEYEAIDINGNAIPRPERVQPSQMESAMVQMMGMIEHDIQASLGMFKAAVGEASSQQSGKALLALQRESDTGTSHFSDNLSSYSMCYAGRQIVDLVPKIYDTKRTLRILGEDGTSKSAQINPNQKQSIRKVQTPDGVKNIYNLGVGEYDVTVTVGPSYNTKRMEAASVFTELARSATDPGVQAVMNYLGVKNSDITSSDEAITMLKAMLPPQVQSVEDGQAPIPPQVMAQIQQMQQQGQLMQQHIQEITQENQQLKAGTQVDMAKVQATVNDSQAKNQARMQEHQMSLDLEREKAGVMMQLEREKTQQSLELEAMKEQASQETALRKAALDNATKIEIARIAATKDAAEGQPTQAGTDTTNIMQQILDTQNQLLQTMQSPKTMSVQMADGRVHIATSQPTLQ